MNTTITENDENVREVNVDALLEDVLSFEKGTSPKSPHEMRNVYNLPLKKRGLNNTFSQKPLRKNPTSKAFGKLPNFTKKSGGKRRRQIKKLRKTRKSKNPT